MLRRNLFIGIPNDKLKECYDSYIRVSCKRENEKELFSDLVTEYNSFIESNHPKAAEANDKAATIDDEYIEKNGKSYEPSGYIIWNGAQDKNHENDEV